MMNVLFRPVFFALVLLFCLPMIPARAQTTTPTNAALSPAGLQAVVDAAAQQTLAKFAAKKLGSNQLAITLVDLRDAAHPVTASYRGETQIYPASVVKLFYLVAAFHELESGKMADTAELRRAMHDMIVDSLNEATGYIVDLLTDTTSGPELPPAEMATWQMKRNAVNRYFESLGYTNINVNKKPWCEGPYGREKLATQLFKPSRNWLTTDATARLLTEIVTDKAASPAHCAEMRELLRRDFFKPGRGGDDQAHAFTAGALPPGAKLWSKAGWTSDTRHDAAYVELPDGSRFVLVTFTEDHAEERQIIPSVARAVMAGMAGMTGSGETK